MRRPAVLLLITVAGARAGDRLFQHLLVKLEPDLLDVSGLFFAKQIAGAADIEIVAGQLEAGAKRVERLQHLQAAVDGWRKQTVGGNGEQRIGARLGAPDPSAQLIELRQTEHVGAVDDQRVGGRDVEAGFDNRRAQKNVIAAIVERRHDLIEFAGRHAAMGGADPRFGHVIVKEFPDVRQIGDARHDIECLATAQPFAQQRLADRHGVEGRNECAHRKPVNRRCGDH